MAKTSGTFKLGKQFKTMLALTKGSNEQRNGWKRMFIDAQQSAEIAKMMSKKNKKERTAE